MMTAAQAQSLIAELARQNEAMARLIDLLEQIAIDVHTIVERPPVIVSNEPVCEDR